MSVRYHLTKDGLPGVCKAKHSCPLGGDDEHFTDKVEALAAAERKLVEENDYLSSKKKAVPYHVGADGAPEECPYVSGACQVKPYGRFKNVHSLNRDMVNGAAKAFREAQAAETKKADHSYGRPVTARKPTPGPPVASDPVTSRARDVLSSGNTGLTVPSTSTWVNGTHKIDASDRIFVQIEYNASGCSVPSYSSGKEFYGSLQDALDAGWAKDEIRVLTVSSCHHSSSVPDFSDPQNLAKRTTYTAPAKSKTEVLNRGNFVGGRVVKVTNRRAPAPPKINPRPAPPSGHSYTSQRYGWSC